MDEQRGRSLTGTLLGLLALATALWQLLPIVLFIPVSFTGAQSFRFPPPSWSTRWWEALVNNPQWIQAFVNSFLVAVAVCVISTTLGTLAAFGIVRSRSKLAGIVRLLTLTPVIMPSIIVAVGIYSLFLRWHLTGSYLGFVLAYAGMGAPFTIIVVAASVQTMDRNLERAAMSLGAGPLATFRLVTLPFIRPGLLAGAFFAFMGSFDEVITALFISSPRMRTLPVVVWNNTTDQIDPTVAVIATVYLMVVGTGLLAIFAFQLRSASTRGIASVMGVRL
jgi:putative spermidine/putrescine transport system permease protein